MMLKSRTFPCYRFTQVWQAVEQPHGLGGPRSRFHLHRRGPRTIQGENVGCRSVPRFHSGAARIRRCDYTQCSRSANPACTIGGDFDKRAREYSANTIRRDELADDAIARRIFG